MTPTTPELEVARAAARIGGAILVDRFRRGVRIEHKGPVDLVTEADTAAEAAIVASIRAAYPGHAILAEEGHRADSGAPDLWVIDPLDGTTNFAHGLPHFAVSIAHYRAGTATCGVVFNPLREEWYEALRGGGAWHDGRPARVSETSGLEDSLVGTGFFYDRGAMMEATLAAIRALFGYGIHGIRRFGAASLDLCDVATGRFGAFFEYELAPWDFAAGRLVVEEAGGRITTCAGEPLSLARTSMLASNGLLHDAMLEIVGAHRPKPSGAMRSRGEA